MKLWLDDERPVPDDSWVLAKTVDDLKTALQENQETLEEVSLDFVLVGRETGLDALLWMKDQDIWPAKLTTHSSGISANFVMIEYAQEVGPAEMVIERYVPQ